MQTANEIKNILSAHKNEYHRKYGVKNIGIFGSYARNEQKENSDVDILVEFDRPIGLKFVTLADDIEYLLNIRVDLVSRKAIKPRMWKYIAQELINA